MRLLLAALAVTFAIAVTASVFAIWPAVADAPWEDETPTPVIQKAPTPDRCGQLIEALGNASQPYSISLIQDDMREYSC